LERSFQKMQEHLRKPCDEYDFSRLAILKVPKTYTVRCCNVAAQTIWPLHSYPVPENLDGINWMNARKSVTRRTTINVAMTILSIALSCAFAVPVTFSASLGQIEDLTKNISWLFWVRRIPPRALAYLQGAVPQLLVAGVVALVPSFLSFLSTWHCHVTNAQAEVAYYRYYSAFLFLQTFLLVSISSSLMVTLSEVLSQPSSIPRVLALNLPKAGNYFISFLTLQGFSLFADMVAQWSYLLKKTFKKYVWSSTPRRVAVITSQDPFSMTSMYSVVALLGVIGKLGESLSIYFRELTCVGTVYSIITPLALIPSSLGLFALLIAIKPALRRFKGSATSTDGEVFLSVINQLFVGLYIMQLCLAGIFISVESRTARFACKIQAILTLLLLSLTFCFHFVLVRNTNRRLLTVFPPSIPGEDESQTQTVQDQSGTMNVPPLLGMIRSLEIPLGLCSSTSTSRSQVVQKEASEESIDPDLGHRTRIGMVPHIPRGCEHMEFRLQIHLWMSKMTDFTHSEVQEFAMTGFKGLKSANNSLKLEKVVVGGCLSYDTPTEIE
jgi:hypothetical protein